jgi:hypothetical protein
MNTKIENGMTLHFHIRITGQSAYWHPVDRMEIYDWKANGIKDHHMFR